MSRWDAWLAERATLRVERGVVRSDPVLRDPDRPVLDLASNDYLGLSQDPRVVAAARAALDLYGASATASRLVTGTLSIHRELEDALCALTGQPSALAFSTGYAANLGVLTALSLRGAEILLDEHAHASLHDAARMARVPHETFRHNDPADLAARLADRGHVRVLVAVESIYSVLGDAAPLAELLAVCEKHDALLVVDEAHGIGVAGRGRGLVHELGLVGSPHLVVTATLSKSLGSQGGAVLASLAIREHLVNTARSFIFDTGLAPAAAGAAAAAARLVAHDPGLATSVRRHAAVISGVCGIDEAAGAVQSIPMASPEAAVAACLELRAAGVLVGCFRPPSVPDGVSRLRITARADLTPDEVEQAAGLVAEIAAAHSRSTSSVQNLPPPAPHLLHTRPEPPSSVQNLPRATRHLLHTRRVGGSGGLPRVVVITGTDTEVGKTVATAALAALLVGTGRSVTAYKPVQTGVTPGEPGDMAEVSRITGIATHEGCRLRGPMAPRPAAEIEHAPLPSLEDHLAAISALRESHDHVLVEGAGGLLVELTEQAENLADLAGRVPGAGVVVVARSALGTLNHTMLTREALVRRGLPLLGSVIGAWPAGPDQPSVIETTNRAYLSALPEGLAGAIPRGAPSLEPRDFAESAPRWLEGLAQRIGTP